MVVKKIPNFEDHSNFLSNIRVDLTSECWNWVRTIDKKGYGTTYIRDWPYKAHRVSFSLFKKEIEEGFVIDHICRNRKCVNPDHLREVTSRVNTMENSMAIGKLNSDKTHCIRGHEFTKENTMLRKAKYRLCITCKMERYHRVRKKLHDSGIVKKRIFKKEKEI